MTFAGTWECWIKTPVGRQEFTLVIQEQSGSIVGHAKGVETVALQDPVVENGRLRWTQRITKPMPLTIKFDVTHDGDDLSGSASPGFFPSVKVIGRRLSSGTGA